MKEKIKIGIIGTLSGFFTGLVGGFGALVSIIGFKKFFHLSQKEAQATSMAFIFIVSIISSLLLITNVEISMKLDEIIYIIIFNIFGALCGYFIFSKVPNNTLNLIFGAVIAFAGGMMIWF